MDNRNGKQEILESFKELGELEEVLDGIRQEWGSASYDLKHLSIKFTGFCKKNMNLEERLGALIQAAVELTTQEAPDWEYIGARLLMVRFNIRLKEELGRRKIGSFFDKICFLTEEGLYGDYILENYNKEEIQRFEGYMDQTRNHLFNYSGLELLLNRYVIRSHQNAPLETPQEMFLGIAMHLAMNETVDREAWVKRFYHMLSTLKVTMATPTLSNARKPYHQLSSCFIDTVPDSLDGIYRSIDSFAKVSKFGGGMGLYFGKVRAAGSAIRGFKGAAGGVVRWIKLANDTAVAVDQLGMRQGAVAVYLDVWHKDLPEFLTLKTNNGDDRMKAHDVFPGVCYPNLFWKQAKENIEGDWYLMCPHEILTVKGWALEDFYGIQWEERYLDCVSDSRIHKRIIPIKDIIRLVLKSAVETGTPFTFNRDIVNEANPNSHCGMIYCSNLCTEIAQNMSTVEQLEQQIRWVDGETVVVTVTKPGDFVVCNLASLSLGKIDLTDTQELAELTRSAVRALDNVIDLNFFPIPYAKVTNLRYRPVGLGVSGYHHMLAKNGISWESQEHLEFSDRVFEAINYAAIQASCDFAREKGRYDLFEGSQWQTGAYFDKRGYCSEKWKSLREKVAAYGMRNGWLLAIAPTSSTSMIAGTTAGLDPVLNRYYLEEKKSGLVPRVAPDLSPETFWKYKNAHYIDQKWSVRAAGVRQRHVDQAQSMNLYITNDYTLRQVLGLYILAWECGVKTIYYIRSRSLEVEECEACSS
ncbi:ribonucleoside-diphosphate reductase subunit alpha [Lacrimispora saccharolytica]|uniref:Ribonucleoside-diphosphate reductase n=1 Tax=Lacrimispora saccharolytica (strain ATCC 35040 / DSM 2544 / NRCC 2533 / WM1) TaxID=610130 RepID=D9RAF3_LACSW|nr:ribonucleoside-diphosphate reductase subunit alpha [Lacrimispora saccharolytica]ADL04231.1 ribonucleoside-diphosphate reductase, alpha subunit [[Clostridium] saccharolyticum WM1]QRV21488.1 ribonucleoside-diphosphate reductase subunit alpha [Lacrimispora saccharolytica]